MRHFSRRGRKLHPEPVTGERRIDRHCGAGTQTSGRHDGHGGGLEAARSDDERIKLINTPRWELILR
jgi:hypothetical protein